MHIDVLMSSTAWTNFFALRDHPDAEPHIAVLARETRAAMTMWEPELLKPGQWHLPYVDLTNGRAVDIVEAAIERGVAPLDVARKISVARCARISYAPFDGDGSIEKEIERHDALVGAQPMHASPAEHQATPDQRKSSGISPRFSDGWWHTHEHGNFTGWRQYRKMIDGEAVMEQFN